MNADLIEDIRLFASFSFVFPLLIYLFRFRQVPIQHHIVGILVIISGSIDLVTYFKLLRAPMLHNIYGILEFSLITSFYYQLVYRKRGSLVMLISIGVAISVLLLCLLKYDEPENYLTPLVFSSLMCLVHGLMYMANIQTMPMDRYFDPNLLSNMIFNAAFLFYGIATFPIFAAAETIFRLYDLETIKAFWAFHNIFAIIKNLGFGIALHYTGKREIYMTLEQLEKIAKKLREEEQPYQ